MLQDTADKFLPELDAIKDPIARRERLAELHVSEGVETVARTDIVQKAWASDQSLWIHGWKLELETGELRDLNCTMRCNDDLKKSFSMPGMELKQ